MNQNKQTEIDSTALDFNSRCKLTDQKMALQEEKTGKIPNNNNQKYNRNQGNNAHTHSGSGHESSLSSASSSHEGDCSQTSDFADDSSAPSSGRSSANRESIEDVKLLNQHSNIVPERSEVLAAVDAVRIEFLSSFKEEDKDLYESLDIDELLKPLPKCSEQEQSLAFRLISRFVDFKKILANNSQEVLREEVEEAVKRLKELLKFRHQYKLTNTLPEHFAKEFYILSGIFEFGHDKQNIPVLYIRARVHRKWSPKLDESFRRYVAWRMDLITKSYKSAKVVKTIGFNGIEKDGSFGICFDCLNVSYSCLDLDFLKFLVSILLNYYPHYCRYALCVDLPWLFRSVWKLVRTWLPEDAQNSVHLITAKQLTDFINEDQIPNSMKINDKEAKEKPIRGRHEFPKNYDDIRDLDGLGEELGVSKNEIKQLKSHVEKIKKEYEKSGAI